MLFLFCASLLPFPHVPITGKAELVLPLSVSHPVTPVLILMLNYFSFANNMAQLQSAGLNMYGACLERTGFMEMRIHRCPFRFSTGRYYWWHCAYSTHNSGIEFVSGCVCVSWGLSVATYLFECVCVLSVTSHLVTPNLVITSTNAEYAWLYS